MHKQDLRGVVGGKEKKKKGKSYTERKDKF